LTLIVEAKHGAAKSGFQPIAEKIESTNASARAANVSKCQEHARPTGQIICAQESARTNRSASYLTHHRSIPREDMDESVNIAGGDGPFPDGDGVFFTEFGSFTER